MPLSGGHLAFTWAGTGPEVLLLIHGLGGNRQTWRHLISALARTHTVIAPDLPGHGESDPPAGDYSLGAHASAVRDLLLSLGHRRASMVGHSLGGGVALQMAYQFPDRTDRLILIGSGGLGVEVAPILRAATLPGAETVVAGLSRIPTAVTRRVLSVLPPLAAASDAGAVAGVLRGLAGHEQRRAFVRTAHSVIDWRGQTVSANRQLGLLQDVPVMVAWGDRDTTIPPEHHRSFAERVPHVVTAEIPGAGHYPHETAPAAVLEAMQSFLGTTTPYPYSEAGWAELLTTHQAQSPVPPTAEPAADDNERWGELLGARRITDMAIGALTALRGCTEQEAISEVVIAGAETGLGTARISRALVDLLADERDGDVEPYHATASDRWRYLLGARTKAGYDSHVSHIDDDVTIRYGGVTEFTRC